MGGSWRWIGVVAVLQGSVALGASAPAPIHVSPRVDLGFAVPAGLRVYEREISTDTDPDRPGRVVWIRLVPKGLSEVQSLGEAARVQIEAWSLKQAVPVEQWLAEGCASAAVDSAEDSRAKVGGLPAVRRWTGGKAGVSVRYFVTRGLWAYAFSSGDQEGAPALLEAVVRSVRFGKAAPIEATDAASEIQPASAATPRVRMVYLVPSDTSPSEGYRLGMERAIRQLQAFYRAELGGSKTFSLNDTIVEVLPTSHPVSWYTTDAPSASADGRFWQSVLADAFALVGSKSDDPMNRWILYIDASPLCGQYIGGNDGIAVLPRNDLRGLTCDGNTPPCVDRNPDLGGICRWVGGLGHELGHAFNLPHPTAGACPAPDPDCEDALMGNGYRSYPSAYLTPADESSLLNSSRTSLFFTVLDPGPVPYSCTGDCPPGRPTGLSALPGNGPVSLAWGAAAGATSYTVRRSASSVGPFGVVASDLPGLVHVDTGLTSGTYFYLVTGVNGSGESPNSNLASATLSGPPVSWLRIEDRAVSEGANASFRVLLSRPSDQTVTVRYAAEDGTATAGSDYAATSGTLTFTPGRTAHSLFVPTLADAAMEGPESFVVTLSDPVNALLDRGRAVGTIDDPPAPAVVPMYRAYNPNADYHFFTTSLAEFENAVAAGYRDESNPPCCSIPFLVPNTQVAGASAIFRMYNPNNGRHYYTASAGERDSLKGVGWVYEKDEGFVFTAVQPGTAEVFRLYNHNSGVHLYTANAGEKNAILAAFPGIWFQHTSLGFAVP